MAGYQILPPRMVEQVCSWCQAAFNYEKAGAGRFRRQCSTECVVASRAPPKMFKRECVECSASFETPNAKTVCCGTECGRVRGKRLGDIGRAAAASKKLSRVCEQCSKSFVMRNPSGKARKGLVVEGRFCSRACGKAFRAANPSPKHQAAAAARSEAANARAEQRARGKAIAAEARAQAAIAAKATASLPARRCPECDEMFDPNLAIGRKPRFCGKKCSKAHNGRIARHTKRLRLKTIAKYEPVNPMKVFERDGWKCHLCRKKTPRKLRGTTDPRAPEMDHIMPLSKGGDHTYANVACSCRACNQAKSNTPMGQTMLFCEPV
jgi:5-methylcytosine-specific restriction endonuclease McrA